MILLTLFLIAQGVMTALLAGFIYDQHKRTRKETQEIKVRLTNIKKRQLKKGGDK